jgi:capsular polysaccharide transport system permease protein
MTAIFNWLSLVNFLAVRNISARFKQTPIAAILALLAPILVLAGMLFVRGFLKGRYPQYGLSLAVFFASGIFPFFVFMRMALAGRGTRYRAVRRFPRFTSTDTLITSLVTEGAIILSSMLICFYGLWLYGYREAKPVYIVDCLVALFFLAMLGTGFGLINLTLARHFKLWGFVYRNLTRGMLFLSGVFHMVDPMPLFIRNIMVWNPIMHGIEWFRVGLYGTYPAHTLDRLYLIEASSLMLLVGLVAHGATLRGAGTAP